MTPAKLAFGLAERIYVHVLECGFVVPGDSVIDPFGGVAGGGLHAALAGLHWYGCELEPKFVALAEKNIDRWTARYGCLPKFVRPTITQGDSRFLTRVLSEAGLCVSSPPYAGQVSDTGDGIDWSKATRGDHKPGMPRYASTAGVADGYGATAGQLAALKATDAGHALAVSSPPYAESVNSGQGGIDWDKAKRPERWTGNRNRNGCQAAANHEMRYGTSEGQLGAMKAGDLVVSSPPFLATTGGVRQTCKEGVLANDKGIYDRQAAGNGNVGYGDTPGSLGCKDTSDFWTAARQIVEQTYLCLRPGAHAVWIVKAFVRKGQIVDFPGQWRELCESVGFTTTHEHHALLTEHRGSQATTGGDIEHDMVKRVSFFRRLHEKKNPASAINHETVYCMER